MGNSQSVADGGWVGDEQNQRCKWSTKKRLGVLGGVIATVIIISVFAYCHGNDKTPPFHDFDWPIKKIFSIQVWQNEASKASGKMAGNLRLCNQDWCCEIPLAVPLVTYFTGPNSRCTERINKETLTSVRVYDADANPANIDKVQLILEDGATFAVGPGVIESNAWGDELELKEVETEALKNTASIRVMPHDHDQGLDFQIAPIEVRVLHEKRPPCSTNLIKWSDTEAGLLRGVRGMGSCFAYNMTTARNNIQVRYNPPKGFQSQNVAGFKLKSQYNKDFCWEVELSGSSSQWINATFDEDC